MMPNNEPTHQDVTPMTQREQRRSAEAPKQRAILADPVAFGDEAYGKIVGGMFDDIFIQDVPDATDEVNERLLDLLKNAAQAGDLATLRKAIGLLPDMTVDARGIAFFQGMRLGAIFERFRHDLVAYLATMDRRQPNSFEDGHGQEIARLRAAMTAAAEEEPASDDAALAQAVATVLAAAGKQRAAAQA